MRRVKSKGTTPELTVRALLRRAGIRMTYQPKSALGKPDFARVRDKVAVFVHGCFWHGHRCKRGARIPKSNRAYWVKKIEGNGKRDRAIKNKLRHLSWRVYVIWECRLQSGVDAVVRGEL